MLRIGGEPGEASLATATEDIQRIIANSADFNSLFQFFAEYIAQAIPADTIAHSRVDTESRTYTPVHRWGLQNKRFRYFVPRSYSETVIERLISSPAGFIVGDDVRSIQENRHHELGEDPFKHLQSWAVSPIKVDDRIIGALQVRHNNPNVYTSTQVRFLDHVNKIFSNSFLRWSRLYAAESETKILRSLAELGRIANSTLDLSSVYDQIAQTINSVVPYDHLVINSLFEDDSDEYLLVEHAESRVVPDPQLKYSDPIVEDTEIITYETSAVLIDVDYVEKYPELENSMKIGESLGYFSWLYSPLMLNGKIIGSIQLRNTVQNAYGLDHLRIVRLISDQLSTAVDTTRRYRTEQRQSVSQVALTNIAFAASKSIDQSEIYSNIAGELKDLFGYDRMTIILYDRNTNTMSLDFIDGLRMPGEAVGDDVTSHDNRVDWQVHVNSYKDLVNDQRGKGLTGLGLQSWIQAPIGLEASGPDGFLSLRSQTQNTYTPEDEKLLVEIAKQVTPSIQNARLYNQAKEISEHLERAAQLDEENIELQRIADSRSEFLSTVSHELRTPLTAISAFGDILRRNTRGNLNKREIDQVDVIRRSAATLATLIDDLLDVSRADTGRLAVERSNFEIQAFINELKPTFKSFTESKNQTLTIRNIESPQWINADRSRLGQIVNKLIVNASKYSPESSTIEMTVDVSEGKLYLTVEDHGIGISPNDLSSVFTPFFRAANTQTQQENGTGLGLTVVKQLVNEHGGEVEMTSELDHGTKVSIWLPGIISPPTN